MMITNRRGVNHIMRWLGKWSIAPFGLYRFPLPDLGEKIKEGKVKKLYVREGDSVEEFQKIADVESDKQFTEISAPENGIVKKLYFLEDQTCQVGQIFLDIETASTSQFPATRPSVEKKQERKPTNQPVSSNQQQNQSYLSEDVLASATVKMWAREHNIDLSQVNGTGKKGRVLKEDIIYFLEDRKKSPSGANLKAKIQPESRQQPIFEPKRVQMNDLQKLQQGLATYSTSIPHLYLQELFDVTSLTPILQSSNKPKITLLSLLLKTFSLALTAHQRVNSIYQTNEAFKFAMANQQHLLLTLYGQAHLAYAMINNLEKQSIVSIQKQLNNIRQGVTDVNQVRQMVKKATISLSYVGEEKVMTINPPIIGETICHLSIGDVRDVPVSQKGQIIKRQQVSVVLGGDHRVIDGASAARFMSTWRQYSQNSNSALLTMI